MKLPAEHSKTQYIQLLLGNRNITPAHLVVKMKCKGIFNLLTLMLSNPQIPLEIMIDSLISQNEFKYFYIEYKI